MATSTATAAAAAFLLSQGGAIDMETVPYIEDSVDSYVSYPARSQTNVVNKSEYACESMDLFLTPELTHCPGQVAEVETSKSSEYGMFLFEAE